ncbi:hypothetical protein KCU74_g17, partial [Aureobasidium melanogenum]
MHVHVGLLISLSSNIKQAYRAYLDCICSLISQLEWLFRISDILVDKLVDKFLDRIDATRSAHDTFGPGQSFVDRLNTDNELLEHDNNRLQRCSCSKEHVFLGREFFESIIASLQCLLISVNVSLRMPKRQSRDFWFWRF